jgi:hypothetical protein
MKNKNPIIEDLRVLKDEVKLQAHLFSMESKDKFEAFEVRFYAFEKKIENYASKLGDFNEGVWGVHNEDLDKLKKEYDELKKSNVEGR